MPWGQDVAQGHIDAINYAKARPDGGVSKFNLGTASPAPQQM
jgi:UDP-glucose 4-epimerase